MKELNEKQKAIKTANEDKVREGKTARDRASGAKGRNEANKEARRTWRNESRGSKMIVPFPEYTLGGKGTSSRPYKVIAGRGRSQDWKPV